MESQEALAVSIPTRNRCAYLKELLDSIKMQVNDNPDILNFIKVYVFDNNSNDGTEQMIESYPLPIIYKKNSEDIGGDRNIHQAYTAPKAKYIWVMGDDELLPARALEIVLGLLWKYQPALLINNSGYQSFVEVPQVFNNYQEFAEFATKYNSHLLLAHSLISVNVIRKDCFDKKFAWENINECYSHMFGMAQGLKLHLDKIIAAQEPTLIVRKERAVFDVTDQAEYHKTVLKGQITYLAWLKQEYSLKDLTPERVVANYERRWYPGLSKVAVVINFEANLNNLAKVIESVLGQSYCYLEIYIINTDDTIRQLFQAQKEDNPYGQDVRYIDVEKGVSEQEITHIVKSYMGNGLIIRLKTGMLLNCPSYISCFLGFISAVRNNHLC